MVKVVNVDRSGRTIPSLGAVVLNLTEHEQIGREIERLDNMKEDKTA